MDYEEMRAFQRSEEGDDSPIPLSFTADEAHDIEPDVLMLAMERDMDMREKYWQRRAEVAESLLQDEW